ncbi:hypothetical protein ACVWWQ_002699 [Rhodanobacter sp. TND4EL1]
MERRSLLRPLAFATLTFGVVWCAMILRWRALNRVPNGVDVALCLVALPLGLLLGFVLLRRLIDAAKKRRKIATALTRETVVDDVMAPEDPSLAWQLSIFAADALFAGGDAPDSLAEAARASQRVDLHPALRDQQGLPVFAATVADVDTDTIEDSLPETMQGWSESRKRTIALAQMLVTRMLDEHFEPLHSAAVANASSARATAGPVLQLEWLLPARWSDADRDLAQTWLVEQLAAQGWHAPALQVTAHGMHAGAAVLRRLDDLNRAFHGERPPLPHLLLASDSHVDESTVAEWSATQTLHGAGRPEGLVPGEGASAVLLACTHPAGLPELARLHRMLAGQRAKAVDSPGRLQADTFNELVGQALERAGVDAGATAYLVSDTDMRASRAAEAMHLAESALPERDPIEVLLPLGVANGECGAALTLATVAVAAHQAAGMQQPGLILSHHDASLRAVAVVVPPPPAATTSTTPSLA